MAIVLSVLSTYGSSVNRIFYVLSLIQFIFVSCGIPFVVFPMVGHVRTEYRYSSQGLFGFRGEVKSARRRSNGNGTITRNSSVALHGSFIQSLTQSSGSTTSEIFGTTNPNILRQVGYGTRPIWCGMVAGHGIRIASRSASPQHVR